MLLCLPEAVRVGSAQSGTDILLVTRPLLGTHRQRGEQHWQGYGEERVQQICSWLSPWQHSPGSLLPHPPRGHSLGTWVFRDQKLELPHPLLDSQSMLHSALLIGNHLREINKGLGTELSGLWQNTVTFITKSIQRSWGIRLENETSRFGFSLHSLFIFLYLPNMKYGHVFSMKTQSSTNREATH